MNNKSGFTLLELMICLAITAIISAFGIPSLISWRNNAQLSRAAQDVYSHFQRAKIEAVRRNEFCTITFNVDNFVVFVDLNQNFAVDPGEEVIKRVELAHYPGVSLNTSKGGGDGLSFVDPDNGISFAPNGFPQDNSASLAGGTVYLVNQSNKVSAVVLSPAGNVSIN